MMLSMRPSGGFDMPAVDVLTGRSDALSVDMLSSGSVEISISLLGGRVSDDDMFWFSI